MPAFQTPLAPAQVHRNQQLFSDYYLDNMLPQRPDWKMLALDAAPVMRAISAIFEQFTPSANEAQTEEGLIKPVLLALGHTFEVQAALKTPDGAKRPDYVFYRDVAPMNANKNKTLDETLLQPGGLAVGDAKYWDRPLDTALKTGGDPFTNKNPSFQIAFYMQHSGLAWGILTNGRRWRLYHRDTAHKLDRFYEIDLPELLERNDPEAFLYFYAFFHRSAFDAQPLGLDALLQASTDFARGISDDLKAQVYTALRHLAQGFLDYAPNNLHADSETLATIYDNCLIVLYRLLFVLYAEARDLLPVRENDSYRRLYSLDAIKRDIARNLDSGAPLLATSATLWARLKALFEIINYGSPPLQVATFNGGLFDPQRHAFLEQHSIGDARLQQAIDMLARVGGTFIDYRDLAERHLGSIYEGLLEYHLEALTSEPSPKGRGLMISPLPEGEEPEVRVGRGRGRMIAPLPRGRGAGGEGWSVDLLNDRGERHRTGSYYTPEFVVQYIVEQTLGPVLEAAVANKRTDAEKIDAVLQVNCLDPAMGSGHFPVAATEYIARFLVNLGVTPTDEGRTTNDESNGDQRRSSLESDLTYWKRRVAQNCIYGVDLNPLAVDLAKLSLWLATVAKDKPLSFLDHHLRCGNALVGTRVSALTLNPSPAGRGKSQARVRAAKREPQGEGEAIVQGIHARRPGLRHQHALGGRHDVADRGDGRQYSGRSQRAGAHLRAVAGRSDAPVSAACRCRHGGALRPRSGRDAVEGFAGLPGAGRLRGAAIRHACCAPLPPRPRACASSTTTWSSRKCSSTATASRSASAAASTR